MKVRTGFVSNSSSASFILYGPEDYKIAEQHGVAYYSVGYILNVMKEMEQVIKEKTKPLPHFIQREYDYICNTYHKEKLEELFKTNPTASISEMANRNWIYEECLAIFESD